jgi:hypothetical protein
MDVKEWIVCRYKSGTWDECGIQHRSQIEDDCCEFVAHVTAKDRKSARAKGQRLYRQSQKNSEEKS